jgi:hypothetical protein
VARAAEVALGLDPDHLPSLRALRDLPARAGGRAAEDTAALEARAAEAHRAGDAPAEARALLARAGLARERGEADAPLALALAGEAALDAGLPVEAEAALRSAVAMGLGRDEARAAWTALARLAHEHRDAASERTALGELVRATPTGERPRLLVRRARLELEAGDLPAARAAAVEALALAPGDLVAVEASLEVARAGDDAAEVARLLERRAALDPDQAGPILLERARLLAALGRPEEAEPVFGEALSRLPPERALADEHAALRRRSPPPVGALPWGEPLERFAARVAEADESARALRDAVALARAQCDTGGALRAARRAHAREADPGFETGVLADLLHAGGAIREGLAHLRPLLAIAPEDADTEAAPRRLAALAELAEDVGDVDLCLSALDQLLRLRPHDADALEWRFRVDPDRVRAATRLAEGAAALRSRRRRSLLLARAAASTRAEGRDPGRAGELLDLARQASEGTSRVRAEVEELRLAAARAHHAADPASEDLLAALAETAASRRAAGDAAGAARLLEEAAGLGARMGRPVEAAAALATLAEQARERGDGPGASRLARRAARGLREGGDAAGAEAWLRRALELDPSDPGAWNDLEALALSRGDAGAPLLAEILSFRAARAEGPARAESLVALARVLRGPGRDPEGALAALREALSAAPGEASAQSELERLLAATGRHAELGAMLAARAAAAPDGEERSRLRLRAAEILMDGGDDAARAGAEAALEAVLSEPESGRSALLQAAGRLAALGRAADAAARLLELARSDPTDGAAAQALSRALADRPRERRAALQALADATPPGPGRAAHLREAAVAAEEQGDAAGARDLRLAAYLATPGDDGAFREALALLSGDADRAAMVLAARGQAVPADAPACHRSRGDLLLAAGRAAEAALAYQDGLAVDPSDLSALGGLAEALAAAGDAKGALAAARRRVEVAAGRGDEGLRREALETGVALAERLGDGVDGAAALLEDLCAARLAGGGGDEGALVDRAVEALARAGENARAEALLGLAAGAAAGHLRADLLWRLGDAAEARGDREAARAAWNEALAGDPDPGRRARRLDALRGKRDPTTWSQALEQIVADGDGAPELLLELGRARARGGDVAGAVQACSRLLELGPDVPGRDEAVAILDEQRARQGDERAAARVHARRASAAGTGATAVAEWLASAGALERAGADPGEVRTALAAAADATPDDAVPRAALATHLERHGDAEGAARAWLAVALRSTGDASEQASLAAARLLDGAGLLDEAERAWGAAAHARPSSWPARRRLAALASDRGDFAGALAHLTAAARREVADEEMTDYLRALARAREGCGRDSEAEEAWRELLARDPSDAEAFERAAARLRAAGRTEEWLALAARHEAGCASDPARRLEIRRGRARLLASLGRAEAAAGAWRAALELAPDDPEARAALAAAPAGPTPPPVPPPVPAGRAAVSPLEGALEAARRDPTDLEALAALRDAAGESATLAPAGRTRTALRELSWVADALLRRARGEDAPPGVPAVADQVPPGIRARAAVVGADGPLARTLALLAPWLEPLFPVDLARHGVGPKDRLTPETGAAYLAPLDAATRALAGRPVALFLGRRPGVSATLENTRPPSLVLGADVGSLDPAAQAFLVGWGVALATSGGVLPSRFAPRDVHILLELACRLSGAEPAAPALPRERAGSFLAALERTVPPSVRSRAAELAPAALEELAALDPATLAPALSETAARVALLHRGDPHAALTALGALDRPSDLARFALSEPYLELRGMILGWT